MPPGGYATYLGHLQLRGTRYAEPYVLSTGTRGVRRGVRYEYSVTDEPDRVRLPTGVEPVKAPVVHRSDMPIGEQLAGIWRTSPALLIEQIFGR